MTAEERCKSGLDRTEKWGRSLLRSGDGKNRLTEFHSEILRPGVVS